MRHVRNALTLLILLCCETTAFSQSLSNGGFEGNFTSTANGWYPITYGSPQFPSVNYGPETLNVHGGNRAQRITVNDLGDGTTLLVQTLDFLAGDVFQGSVWLRADSAMTVGFYFQERVPYYWVPAIAVVDVDTNWQQVIINGGFDRTIPTDATVIQARLVIEPMSTGELLIDDAEFSNITTNVWNSPVPLTDTIPARYFGMHVNKWGVHQTWPNTGHGAMRLWDTGTTWEIMEPWQGALLDPNNWTYDPSGNSGFAFRMDYYVDLIQAGDPTMDIVYTMGKSPTWAAASPTLPPIDINDWVDYSALLGSRFQGRIKHWEIWNEVDQQDYFGELDALKQLSDSASYILKGIDPDNQILSPNFTGPKQLAHFLKAGGGDHVDIISWHHYPGRKPEEMIPEIIGVRDVMARYGQGNKPLWNTEGAVSFMNGLNLPMEEMVGAVSRAYLVQWAFGVEHFGWYCWDIFGGGNDYVDLSYSLSPSQYDSITPSGIAYAQTAQWLKGSMMLSRAVNNGIWVIELAMANGDQGWVVWHPDGSQSFTVPNAWNVDSVHDLDGTSTSFVSGSLNIGVAPRLLISGTSTSIGSVPPVVDDRSVVPQPFSTHCTIHWSGIGNATIAVYDASGREVRRYEGITGGELMFKREDLAAGIHSFTITRNGHVSRGKLCILP